MELTEEEQLAQAIAMSLNEMTTTEASSLAAPTNAPTTGSAFSSAKQIIFLGAKAAAEETPATVSITASESAVTKITAAVVKEDTPAQNLADESSTKVKVSSSFGRQD